MANNGLPDHVAGSHPHPQVVEETLVQNYRRHTRGDEPVLSAQNGFLTTDY